MIWIKISEHKHFVLYENEKSGVKEAFLYTDLGGKMPDRIEAKGGNTNRNRNIIKLEALDNEIEDKENDHK